ncbi:MAG: hypothetical protein VCC20_00110 [Myxococcota bacterium]
MSQQLAASVGEVAGWLAEVYALDLEIEPERFLLSLPPDQVRDWLPPGCRSGLVVIEGSDEIQVGIHLDPQDHGDTGTLLEETSHLVCLAWHAAQDLPVSLLVLELQAEVDRFVFARLASVGPGALAHFENFRLADGLEPASRQRYELANEKAHHYCQSLERRFPSRADTPALLSELRRFYRASPGVKLCTAA